MSKKSTILYIDDEQENLDSFYLTYWNKFNVFNASNFADARKIIAKEKIDLLIIENKVSCRKGEYCYFLQKGIGLGCEPGMCFITQLRDLSPDMTFVLLTTHLNNEIRKKSKELGINWVIEKPWGAAQLDHIISTLIMHLGKQKRKNETIK